MILIANLPSPITTNATAAEPSITISRIPSEKQAEEDIQTHRINKPRARNGQELTGNWQVTVKLDGVHAIWHDEQGWLSRANKPLYNIPP